MKRRGKWEPDKRKTIGDAHMSGPSQKGVWRLGKRRFAPSVETMAFAWLRGGGSALTHGGKVFPDLIEQVKLG
jgi:hypothetical protein